MEPKGAHTRESRPGLEMLYIYIYDVYDVYIYIVFMCDLVYMFVLHMLKQNQSMSPSSQADFLAKCKIIKEKMESKESEVSGRWYTEEAMKKEGKWTKNEIKCITQYCRRFPESLCRCTCDCMPGWDHISTSLILFIYIYVYI